MNGSFYINQYNVLIPLTENLGETILGIKFFWKANNSETSGFFQ